MNPFTKVERLSYTNTFAADFDVVVTQAAVGGYRLASSFMPAGTNQVVLLFVRT